MRKGVLQQVGPPQELYDRPANLFVATFIGSPAMNLFRGSGRRRPAPRLRSAISGSPCRPRRAAPRAGYEGRELALGIRPEDVTAPSIWEHGWPLRGEVALVESLGAERFVHLELAGNRCSPRSARDRSDIDASLRSARA